jgi:hypothetical protein
MESLSITDLGSREGNQPPSSLGYSEEDMVVMEKLRHFSAAMLRQAAADMSTEVNPDELRQLREAAEHGDKAAEKRHDVLQERVHYKRTAQRWLEHWQDTSFEVPFDLCALATWPACEPAEIAKLILDQPDQYLVIAREQKDRLDGPRVVSRPPRH